MNALHRLALAFGLLILCAGAGRGAIMPADRLFTVRSDWHLERYGTDIFILRAVVAPARPRGNEGGLILSCEGSARQIRLELPEILFPGRGGTADGRMLVRGYVSGREGSAVFPVTWTGRQTLALVGSPEARAAALRAFLDVLALRPASLDLLVSNGTDLGRPTFRADHPLHLLLQSNGPEREVTAAFAAGCGLGLR